MAKKNWQKLAFTSSLPGNSYSLTRRTTIKERLAYNWRRATIQIFLQQDRKLAEESAKKS